MSNIDDLFKESLGNHSEPFDSKAWDILSKRLDGVNASAKNPFKKWGLPFAAVVTITSAAFWLYNSNNEVTQLAKTEKTEIPSNTKKENTISEQNRPEFNPKKETNPTSTEQTLKSNDQKTDMKQTDQVAPITPIVTSNLNPKNVETLKLDNIQNISEIEPSKNEMFQSISVPKCLHSSFTFKNTNGFTLNVKGPGINTKIAPKSQIELVLTQSGQYEITDENAVKTYQTFDMPPMVKADLTLDELNYLNGLPSKSLHVKTDCKVDQVLLDGKALVTKGKDMDLLVFKKGAHALEVSVLEPNGCVVKASEDFIIEEEYNLMAVNAFDPLSQDSRKNTFMPYALTKRNTPFRLIIIDPSDGGVIFQSSDVETAWDGIDRRSGKLVEASKAFIWKVSLSQPEINEKSDYIGSIVRM